MFVSLRVSKKNIIKKSEKFLSLVYHIPPKEKKESGVLVWKSHRIPDSSKFEYL